LQWKEKRKNSRIEGKKTTPTTASSLRLMNCKKKLAIVKASLVPRGDTLQQIIKTPSYFHSATPSPALYMHHLHLLQHKNIHKIRATSLCAAFEADDEGWRRSLSIFWVLFVALELKLVARILCMFLCWRRWRWCMYNAGDGVAERKYDGVLMIC